MKVMKARYRNVEVEVCIEDMGDVNLLIQKLNEGGMPLGGGHEEVDLYNDGDGEFRLRLVTYYGAPAQNVYIESK
jgi:hypothetical protein